MKSLIQALIMSIPAFANVVVFLVFIFTLFAIIGLHQFNGIFYNACRLSPEPESAESWIADLSEGRVCSTSGSGSYACPVGQYCRNPSDNMTYSYQYEDMSERPFVNYGISNFDNIGRSFLSVFKIVTSDTWYLYMCNLMDADIPFFGALYSVLLVVIG
jgi:voltage-gated sodium channel type XI alpha